MPKAKSEWDDFEAQAAEASRSRSRCGTAQMLAGLNVEAAVSVRKTLANRDITTPAIRSLLIKRGVKLVPSPNSIQRHRNGVCQCEENERA